MVVLLDESGSFADLWDQVKEDLSATVIANLETEDQFMLIGMDSHGFDFDDVRIPLVDMPHNPLRLRGFQRDLTTALEGLEPRPSEPGTDVFGAVQHAAHFLRRGQEAGYRPILLVFSDMVPDYNKPQTAAEARELGQRLVIPTETLVRFFYVREKGGEAWGDLVQRWVVLFQTAGLDLGPRTSTCRPKAPPPYATCSSRQRSVAPHPYGPQPSPPGRTCRLCSRS